MENHRRRHARNAHWLTGCVAQALASTMQGCIIIGVTLEFTLTFCYPPTPYLFIFTPGFPAGGQVAFGFVCSIWSALGFLARNSTDVKREENAKHGDREREREREGLQGCLGGRVSIANRLWLPASAVNASRFFGSLSFALTLSTPVFPSPSCHTHTQLCNPLPAPASKNPHLHYTRSGALRRSTLATRSGGPFVMIYVLHRDPIPPHSVRR